MSIIRDLRICTTVFTLALGLACGGGSDKPAPKGDKAEKAEAKPEDKGADKPEAAPALAFKKIDHMGLELEVPAGADVMDSSADAPAAMVSSNDYTVMVSTVTEAYPSDFEAAKKSIEGDPNKFQKFTKEEQVEGGWHLEYEVESMMDKSPLYGVEIRSTIDGKQYTCGRNDRSAEARDNVAKACKTLRKAG